MKRLIQRWLGIEQLKNEVESLRRDMKSEQRMRIQSDVNLNDELGTLKETTKVETIQEIVKDMQRGGMTKL